MNWIQMFLFFTEKYKLIDTNELYEHQEAQLLLFSLTILAKFGIIWEFVKATSFLGSLLQM